MMLKIVNKMSNYIHTKKNEEYIVHFNFIEKKIE